MMFHHVLIFGLSVLYSSKEELRTSACDFWCSILSKTEVNMIAVFIEDDLKQILIALNFL